MKIIAEINSGIFYLVLWILYINYVTAATAFPDSLTHAWHCPVGCQCQQQKIYCSSSHLFQEFHPSISKYKNL